MPYRYRLPDPWFSLEPQLQQQTLSGGGTAVGNNALVANKAYYIPVLFPASATLYAMYFCVGSGTSGDYDMGLYDSACSARIASSGQTAVASLDVKTFTFSTPIRVHAGDLLYAALTLSSGTPTVVSHTLPTAQHGIATGYAVQTSALPLPATATPATNDATIFPTIVFGVR